MKGFSSASSVSNFESLKMRPFSAESPETGDDKGNRGGLGTVSFEELPASSTFFEDSCVFGGNGMEYMARDVFVKLGFYRAKMVRVEGMEGGDQG